MRICFDRLCFARERPAPTTADNRANNATTQQQHPLEQQLHTYDVSKPTSNAISVITTSPPCTAATLAAAAPPPPPQQQINPTTTSLTIADYRSVATLGPTDGASINALDPPPSTNNSSRNINKQNNLDLDEKYREEQSKNSSQQPSSQTIVFFNSHPSSIGTTKSTSTTSSSPSPSREENKTTTPTSNRNILEKQFSLVKAENFPTPNAATTATTQTTAVPAADAAIDAAAQNKQHLRHSPSLEDVVELRHINVSNVDQPQSVAADDVDDIVVANGKEDHLIADETTESAKMQQEPNANIQFQPDLGLVNNNNLQALSGTLIDNNTGAIRLSLPLNPADVLTHTLIYGTVPTGAQHLNTDPNLQARTYLHQQELQLQHRYQQLQQLQAQTQGLYATNPSATPIILQPTAGATPGTAVYATTPTDYCTQQKLLAAHMQGLCISTPNTGSPTSGASVMDPTAGGGFNMHNNSYVPATPQEERLIQCIQAKDLKIQEMQRALQYKDNEIAELKSHLDKFQSVFPFSRSGATTPCGGVSSGGGSGSSLAAAGGGRKSGQSFQRQRAQGISAEPQSESSVLLDNVTFPKYDKDDK